MILQRLREETHSAHKQLEEHINLLGRPWSMPFYRDLLQKFYGFYAPIESLIFRHPQWQELNLNVENRFKLPLLREDLCYLGLTANTIGESPICQNTPSLQNFASALGTAYVLEGSTLGGKVISRHLRNELGIQSTGGGLFFAAYGDQVGPMWREFTEVLNTYTLSEAQQNELVHNARVTFSAFDDWLSDIL